ncbi:hypothetical protein GCM10022259_33490 [Aquimarina mytili]
MIYSLAGATIRLNSNDYNEFISHEVTQDETTIYLKLSTSHEETIKKLLFLGTTVYFDINGKENRDVYVNYPLKMEKSNVNHIHVQKEQAEEINLQSILEKIPQQATYGNFDQVQQFHILLNNLNINASLRQNDNITIELTIEIPKNRISEEPFDVSKLSIGVVSGKLEKPSLGNGRIDKVQRGGDGSRPSSEAPRRDRRPRPELRSIELKNQKPFKPINFWFNSGLE